MLKEKIQTNHLAINVKVEELFTRKYQVDLETTHPNMRMRGSSGFILTGVKVNPT